MKADKDLQVLEQEGLNVGYLGLNVEHEPFDNKEVRQAINYADQPGRDPRGGLSGRRQEGEEPDPADDLVLQRRRQGL